MIREERKQMQPLCRIQMFIQTHHPFILGRVTLEKKQQNRTWKTKYKRESELIWGNWSCFSFVNEDRVVSTSHNFPNMYIISIHNQIPCRQHNYELLNISASFRK